MECRKFESTFAYINVRTNWAKLTRTFINVFYYLYCWYRHTIIVKINFPTILVFLTQAQNNNEISDEILKKIGYQIDL